MAKITLTTLKSFLKKNEGNLYIIEHSRFDGMSDMVETNLNAKMHKVDAKFNPESKSTFGLPGVWVVRGSRDWFSERKLTTAFVNRFYAVKALEEYIENMESIYKTK